jgi:hypothetical protein
METKKLQKVSTMGKILDAMLPKTSVTVVETSFNSDDEQDIETEKDKSTKTKSETILTPRETMPSTLNSPRESILSHPSEFKQTPRESEYIENTLHSPRSPEDREFTSPMKRRTAYFGETIELQDLIIDSADGIALPKATPRSPKQKSQNSIARFILMETHFLYKLMELTYDKENKLRNEQYFDWDDINDLCWTPGFVERFLDMEESRFSRVFAMEEHYSELLRLINGTTIGHSIHVRPEEKQQVENLCLQFAKQWKTYFDRSGGLFGIFGFLTIYFYFDQPIRLHFLCLALVGVVFTYTCNCLAQVYHAVIVCSVPILLLILHHLTSLVLVNRTKQMSRKNPYRNQIPRRDAHCDIIRSNKKKRTSCLRIFKGYFSFAALHSFAFVIVVAVLLCLVTVLLLSVAINESATEAQRFIFQYSAGMRSYSTIDQVEDSFPLGIEIVKITLAFCIFAIMWFIAIVTFLSISPFVVQFVASLVAFVRTLFMRTHRIHTWDQFCVKLQDPDTIFIHFATKLLCLDEKVTDKSTEEERLQIEWCWATVWNSIIDDFYINYKVSKDEKASLSYALKDPSGGTEESPFAILKRPDLSIKPGDSQVIYQLCTFMNTLWMNIPRGSNVTVENMKRLVLMTPVARDRVLYTWKELVKPANTDYSFLRTLIVKHQHEWHNWKDRQFPQGNKLRNTVNYIESKVMAGIDITGHQIRKQLTASYVKDQICQWASSRYRSVYKTTSGFLKTAKALQVLLQIQNVLLKQKQRDDLVQEKFSYIIGALAYDEKLWNMAVNYSQLSKQDREKSTAEHDDYVSAFTKICKEDTTGVLKIAHLEATSTQDADFQHEGYALRASTKRFEDDSNDEYSDLVETLEDTHEEYIYSSVLQQWRKDKDSMSNMYKIQAHGCFSLLSNSDRASNLAFMSQFFDGGVCAFADVDMDINLCQCLFVPNLLQEFEDDRVKVLSLPCYTYTSQWSLTAFAAALSQRVYTTMFHRAYSFINRRMFFGAPNIMNGFWMQFSVGTQKLSYTLDDIYTGVDTTLRGGFNKHVDYFELQKATDVCMLLATRLTRSFASGTAQFAISRYAKWIMSSARFTYFEKFVFCYKIFNSTLRSAVILVSTIAVQHCTNIIFTLLTILLHIMRDEESPLLTTMLNKLTSNTRLIVRAQSLIHVLLLLDFMEFFQVLLEKGFFRGLWKFTSRWFVMIFYHVFHFTNLTFYFVNGLSVRYVTTEQDESDFTDLISDTIKEEEDSEIETKKEELVKNTSNYGVNTGDAVHDAIGHKNLLDLYQTYNQTHFMAAVFLLLLDVTNIMTDFYPPYLSFKTIIALILVWAPFIYNNGSFTTSIAYRTWVVLYSEDTWIIKTWIVKHCSIQRLSRLIAHNYYRKQLILEYDNSLDQNETRNIELDLDLTMHLEVRRDSVEDHHDKMRDHMKLKSNKHQQMLTLMDHTPDERRKGGIKNMIIENVKWYANRIPMFINRILLLGEQIVLLALLTLCKYFSYFILLLKILFPSAPPDYEQIYRNNYERVTLNVRLNNIERAQQPIKKKKKKETAIEALDRMREEKNALIEKQRKNLEKLSCHTDGYTRLLRQRRSSEEPLNVSVMLRKKFSSEMVLDTNTIVLSTNEYGTSELGEHAEEISESLHDSKFKMEKLVTRSSLGENPNHMRKKPPSVANLRLDIASHNESKYHNKSLSHIDQIQSDSPVASEGVTKPRSRSLKSHIRQHSNQLEHSLEKPELEFHYTSDSDKCKLTIARYVQMYDNVPVQELDTPEKLDWLLEKIENFPPQLIHEVYLQAPEKSQPLIVKLMDDLDLYRFVLMYRQRSIETTDHVAKLLRIHKQGDSEFIKDKDFASMTFSKLQKEIADELELKSPIAEATDGGLIFELIDQIKMACLFMCDEYRAAFCRIMFEPIEMSNLRRNLMTSEVAHMCADLILQNVGISELLLIRARDYYIYAKEIMVHEELEAPDRCPACRARGGTFDRFTRVEAALKHAISVTSRFVALKETKPVHKPKSILKKEPTKKKKVTKQTTQYLHRRKSVVAQNAEHRLVQDFVDQHFPLQDDELVLSMYEDEQYDHERDRATLANRNRFIRELIELLHERIDAENLASLLRECEIMYKDVVKIRATLSGTHLRQCTNYTTERKVMFLLN